MAHTPTREEALELLRSWQQNENLVAHGLAVEGVMRYMARKRGYDEDTWGIIGLVHDLDWEKYPEEHCAKTREALEQADWPEDWIRAVLSHGFGLVTDVEPQHEMEKVLYTIDELTGLVNATAIMRPSKSVLDMKPKSVKKKWNQKAFAAGVDRSIIEKGAEMLGEDLNTIIEDTIMGMREVADDIGLRGQPSEA